MKNKQEEELTVSYPNVANFVNKQKAMELAVRKTMIVLGSGGHTAEMVEIVRNLDKTKYTPRFYILAKSDKTSRDKVLEVEPSSDSYAFVEILRSRHVKQSYFTSIFTTLLAIIHCIPLLWRIRPNLILCNGPGTCVPICIVAYLLRAFRIHSDCKIVFVESFCRVRTLSLSGKILKYFVDMFVVQWPQLLNSGRQIKYFGKLT